MYYNDHEPAHFHAFYNGQEVRVAIGDMELLSGSLPRRAWSLVLEWAVLYRLELRDDWERARSGQALKPIAPLD
jgi:Domain of unknown function (DUF4160)